MKKNNWQFSLLVLGLVAILSGCANQYQMSESVQSWGSDLNYESALNEIDMLMKKTDDQTGFCQIWRDVNTVEYHPVLRVERSDSVIAFDSYVTNSFSTTYNDYEEDFSKKYPALTKAHKIYYLEDLRRQFETKLKYDESFEKDAIYSVTNRFVEPYAFDLTSLKLVRLISDANKGGSHNCGNNAESISQYNIWLYPVDEVGDKQKPRIVIVNIAENNIGKFMAAITQLNPGIKLYDGFGF